MVIIKHLKLHYYHVLENAHLEKWQKSSVALRKTVEIEVCILDEEERKTKFWIEV